ncbi:MAG: PAS domain-containing protein [Deferribacterales bacterium]
MRDDRYCDFFKRLALNMLYYSFSDGRVDIPDSELTDDFLSNTGIDFSDKLFNSWIINNANHVSGEEQFQSEYFCRRTNRWFCVRTVKDEEGVYASVFSDVTDYKTSEEHLRTLINSTPDIICFKDGQGRWLEANASNLEVFSLTGVDYRGKTDSALADFTPAFYRDAFMGCESTDEKAWQNKTTSHMEEYIPRVTGEQRVFDVVKVPLFYDEAKTERKGLVVLGRDITDRKEAENQIKRQSAFINSLLDSVPDLIFYKDLDGYYVLCNPAFSEFVGVPVEDIIGRTDYDLFPADVAEEFVAHDKKMIGIRKSRQNNEWVSYPDGSRKLLFTLKTPYYDKDGNIIGVLGISRDITELDKKTAELEKLNSTLEENISTEVEKNRQYEQIFYNQKKLADMGRLMSSISHHWRQPLNAIGLYIQDMCQGYTDNTLDDIYVERFGRETMHLVDSLSCTIDNFRNFFRPSAEMENFEVAGDIYELLLILQAEMIHHNIFLSFTCACDRETFVSENLTLVPKCRFAGTEVRGYKDEFNQAMLNILQNAMDASMEAIKGGMTGRGRVEVRLDVSADSVKISVYNKGYTIPDSIADKIFDPYFTTKKDGRGTGIGLFNAKVVIESYMLGSVSFENRPDGVVFIIDIPKKITVTPPTPC